MTPLTGRWRTLRGVVVGLLGLLLTSGGLLAATGPAQAAESAKVLLLLDVSGSMNEKLQGSQTKFAAAKKALKQVAASLPAGTEVGLRVYGSDIEEDQDKNPAACKDTKLVLPVGPLDRTKMDAAVDSFRAQGSTPIAYAMGKGVDDLGGSGKRVLILVSDGEETCTKDPCPTVGKLAGSGVDLQFNAIGLDVGSKARSQLQCIAKAGGGAYYDANDTGSLDQALRKLTQRALRPFEVAGAPVTGTPDPADAPQVAPGQYRDRYDTSGTKRYYTIPRTPGSLVTAWVSTVLRPDGYINSDQLGVTLETADGTTCSDTTSSPQALTSAVVYSVAVRSEANESIRRPPAGCATDPQLRLSVHRTTTGGSDASIPVEIGIAEQPPVMNRADLPGPVKDYSGTASPLRRQGRPTSVVGGSGFSNAPEIGAGSWSDSIAFGDTSLYRVRLDHGQTLQVTASLPGEKGRLPLGLADGFIADVKVLSPAHTQLVGLREPHNGPTAVHVSAASPQVRVRNDELALPGYQNFQPDASTASVAGDYYVSVGLQPISKKLNGIVLPLQLDVAVKGTPSGQPVFATVPTPSEPAEPSAATPVSSTAGPTAAPTDGAEAPRGPSAVALVLTGAGIAVLLGLAATAAVLLVRRRRSGGRPRS